MTIFQFSRAVSSSILFFLFLSLVWLIVWGQQPPSPQSASISPKKFSSSRAMSHVKRIALRPHPTWSRENARVRGYLREQLKTLGYHPLEQKAALPARELHPRLKFLAGRKVTNLMVRVRGTSSSGLVAVLSHYDSASSSPGAADDGAGVAAMLETLRALKHLPRPKNDLLFLMTDAEEIGLWGAKLFLRHHSWAREVKFVLNFEARGSRGPSLMFETTNNNGKAIAAFAKADPAPRATSLFFEVYRHLPNGTDFTVFKRRNIQGLNFGLIESIRDYHHPTDTPERLSQASLQDHGQHMLSLVRYLGSADLSQTKAPNVVYFDVLGRFLVRYSETTSLVLSLVLVFLILLGLLYAFHKGWIRLWRVGGGVLFALVNAALIAGVVGYLAVMTLRWRGKKLYAFYWTIESEGLYAIAFLCLSGCLLFLGLGWTTKWMRRMERALAFMLLWSVLLMLSIVYVPGAAYIVMWPLTGATLACWLRWRMQRSDEEAHFVSFRLWLCELPVLLLTVPLFYHLPYALTLSLTGLSAGLFALFAPLMFASEDTFARAGHRWPALVCLVGFCVFYGLPLLF